MTPNTLACHVQITDSAGESVVLEFTQNKWREVYPESDWQIMTNFLLGSLMESERIKNCWRYERIQEQLKERDGMIDWNEGLMILKSVEQGVQHGVLFMIWMRRKFMLPFTKTGIQFITSSLIILLNDFLSAID